MSNCWMAVAQVAHGAAQPPCHLSSATQVLNPPLLSLPTLLQRMSRPFLGGTTSGWTFGPRMSGRNLGSSDSRNRSHLISAHNRRNEWTYPSLT
jgi:hypothetical protein